MKNKNARIVCVSSLQLQCQQKHMSWLAVCCDWLCCATPLFSHPVCTFWWQIIKRFKMTQSLTFVRWRFAFLFGSARQLQKIFNEVQRYERLTEHQPAPHTWHDTHMSETHVQHASPVFTRETRLICTHTFSSTASAMRRISNRSVIFPECSSTSASASDTNSLYQSGDGLPSPEFDEGRTEERKTPDTCHSRSCGTLHEKTNFSLTDPLCVEVIYPGVPSSGGSARFRPSGFPPRELVFHSFITSRSSLSFSELWSLPLPRFFFLCVCVHKLTSDTKLTTDRSDMKSLVMHSDLLGFSSSEVKLMEDSSVSEAMNSSILSSSKYPWTHRKRWWQNHPNSFRGKHPVNVLIKNTAARH